MRRFALFIGLLVFGGSPVASADPIEWTVASGGNGHTYEVVLTQMSWSIAQAFAESKGGYLATITSAAEQVFLESFVTSFAFKLGGFQDTSAPDFSEPDGGWRWVTGEVWSYTNWSPGEPTDCCPVGENLLTLHRVPANGFEYTWNDNVSLNHLPFIIEIGEPILEPTVPFSGPLGWMILFALLAVVGLKMQGWR